jgi:hypothetical protein
MLILKNVPPRDNYLIPLLTLDAVLRWRLVGPWCSRVTCIRKRLLHMGHYYYRTGYRSTFHRRGPGVGFHTGARSTPPPPPPYGELGVTELAQDATSYPARAKRFLFSHCVRLLRTFLTAHRNGTWTHKTLSIPQTGIPSKTTESYWSARRDRERSIRIQTRVGKLRHIVLAWRALLSLSLRLLLITRVQYH